MPLRKITFLKNVKQGGFFKMWFFKKKNKKDTESMVSDI